METRTVKVSIKQARCWFNGNNKALKELALTVYSEQELALSYESIKLQLGDNNLTTTCVTVPYEELGRELHITKDLPQVEIWVTVLASVCMRL